MYIIIIIFDLYVCLSHSVKEITIKIAKNFLVDR
jgi:hypothetical protein